MKRTLFALILFLQSSLFCFSQTIIQLDRRAQTLEGWGTSLCWWANMVGRWQDESTLDSLLTLLTSPEHLGYNIFRYNIGGGDDPTWRHCNPHHFGAPEGKGLRAEMEGFLNKRGDRYNWLRDSAQVRVLRKIHECNPNAIFEAFSNSAPWWMTVSGCVGGAEHPTEDNLHSDYYTDFAHYLVDVCQHFRDSLGITFRTLAPFNEPMTDYWFCNGSQEGCHFSMQSQIKFLRVLFPILQASQLSTQISASDETSLVQSIRDFKAYLQDRVTLQNIGQWNVHSYIGNDADRQELFRLTQENGGLRLWMSESGNGGRGLQGNLQMAQRLICDMRILRPVAWVDWQYVEEKGDQWSLVESAWSQPRFRVHKNYWVRYQFSHFIRPGYTFLKTDNAHLLAAISPEEQRLVIVILNADTYQEKTEELVFPSTCPFTRSSIHAWRTSCTENAAEITDSLVSHLYPYPNEEQCKKAELSKSHHHAKKENCVLLSMPPLSLVTLVIDLCRP